MIDPAVYCRVVRYSAYSPWNLLRRRFDAEPALRHGTHPEAAELRPVAADAYQDETGDEAGAVELRNPTQHVVFDHDGRVRRGRFTPVHAYREAERAGDFAHDNSLADVHPLGNVDVLGPLTKNRYPDDAYEVPPEPLPADHYRVVHTDPTGEGLHRHDDVHVSKLGRHLARVIQEAAVSDAAYVSPRLQHEFSEHVARVHQAPVEEIHPDSP